MNDEQPSTEAAVWVRPDDERALEAVVRALEAAEHMAAHRDHSNAAIHLAEVRYSPITELLREALETAVPAVRQALQGPVPPPGRVVAATGYRRLTVDVSEVAAQRLELLGAATGTGASAADMAEVVLEQYAKTQSDRYCFEHQRDGCGDAQGRHTDDPGA